MVPKIFLIPGGTPCSNHVVGQQGSHAAGLAAVMAEAVAAVLLGDPAGVAVVQSGNGGDILMNLIGQVDLNH